MDSARARVLGRGGVVLLLVLAACGCDVSEDAASDQPRLVSGVPDPCRLLPSDELAEIVDASVTESKVGDTKASGGGVSCFYLYEDGGIGRLTIEDVAVWRRRYDAERTEYDRKGLRLPEDQAVSGLGDHALLDLRHNELDVRSGEYVLRADHGRRVGSSASGALTPAEKAASRDLQEKMIRAALGRLARG